MSSLTHVVTFRVSSTQYQDLKDEAARHRKSLNEFSRDVLLKQTEEDARLAHLSLKVECLTDEIRELREDLAVAVKALLLTRDREKVLTAEQAELWVKSNLKHVG